jgi:hypothetical protein
MNLGVSDLSMKAKGEKEKSTQAQQIANRDMKIKIVVKGDVSRKSILLNVSPDEFVENVWKKIGLQKLPNLYRLSFEGVELKDGTTLASCGVKDGGEIRGSEFIFKNVSKIHGIYSLGYSSRRGQMWKLSVVYQDRAEIPAVTHPWTRVVFKL